MRITTRGASVAAAFLLITGAKAVSQDDGRETARNVSTSIHSLAAAPEGAETPGS